MSHRMSARKQAFDAHRTVSRVRWAYKMVICYRVVRRSRAARSPLSPRSSSGSDKQPFYTPTGPGLRSDGRRKPTFARSFDETFQLITH